MTLGPPAPCKRWRSQLPLYKQLTRALEVQQLTHAQVAGGLYKTLRAAEVVPGVKGIVVACKKFLRESELSAEGDAVAEESDLAVAIMDKVPPTSAAPSPAAVASAAAVVTQFTGIPGHRGLAGDAHAVKPIAAAAAAKVEAGGQVTRWPSPERESSSAEAEVNRQRVPSTATSPTPLRCPWR